MSKLRPLKFATPCPCRVETATNKAADEWTEWVNKNTLKDGILRSLRASPIHVDKALLLAAFFPAPFAQSTNSNPPITQRPPPQRSPPLFSPRRLARHRFLSNQGSFALVPAESLGGTWSPARRLGPRKGLPSTNLDGSEKWIDLVTGSTCAGRVNWYRRRYLAVPGLLSSFKWRVVEVGSQTKGWMDRNPSVRRESLPPTTASNGVATIVLVGSVVTLRRSDNRADWNQCSISDRVSLLTASLRPCRGKTFVRSFRGRSTFRNVPGEPTLRRRAETSWPGRGGGLAAA